MQNIYSSVLYKKFPVIKCILQIIEKDKTFGMHILKRNKKHFEMVKSRSLCSFHELHVTFSSFCLYFNLQPFSQFVILKT